MHARLLAAYTICNSQGFAVEPTLGALSYDYTYHAVIKGSVISGLEEEEEEEEEEKQKEKKKKKKKKKKERDDNHLPSTF